MLHSRPQAMSRVHALRRLGSSLIIPCSPLLQESASHHTEDHLFPGSLGCISIQVVHRCAHFRSPVAPKRSVLMYSRPWPAAIRRSVAFSTNDVGPQTYMIA